MPVRSKVRGTFAVQSTASSMVSPGCTGAGNGTAITVLSSVLPSSGAMKRRFASGCDAGVRSSIDEMSMREKSDGGRSTGRVRCVSLHPGRFRVSPRVPVDVKLQRPSAPL